VQALVALVKAGSQDTELMSYLLPTLDALLSEVPVVLRALRGLQAE
jgi:hypothetical protein